MKYGEGDREQAIADVTFAIDAGIDDPRAFWTLGYLQVYAGHWDQAAESFRSSIERAPLDPLYRAELAWSLSGWWGKGEPKGSDAELAEARTQFDLAAELAPDDDQYAELARGYRKARGE